MIKKILIVSVVSLISTLAIAKSKTPEIYSATEEETVTLPPQPAESQRKPRQSLSKKMGATEKTGKSSSFDIVPPDQKGPILNRLILVEKLIREHGRAYDYRAYTTQELEQFLNTIQDPALPPPPEAKMNSSESI